MERPHTSESYIKLQLTINKDGREIIKRTTAKGNEVVEVNGFTFVRKRRLPIDAPQQQAPTPKRHQALAQDNNESVAIEADRPSPQLQHLAEVSAGGDRGPAVVAGCAAPLSACEDGSMEADDHHAGQGSSQVQVRLVPHTHASPGAGPEAAIDAVGEEAGARWGSPVPLAHPSNPSPSTAAGNESASPGLPLTAESLSEQLAFCLPANCPTLVKVQFVVAQALGAAAVQAHTPMSRTAHLVSQAFVAMLEGEVTACRQRLVASVLQPSYYQEPLPDPSQEEHTHAQAQPHNQGQSQVQQNAKAGSNKVVGEEGGHELGKLPPMLKDAVMQGSALSLSLQQQLAQLEAEEVAWLALKEAYTRPSTHTAASAEARAALQQHQGEVGEPHGASSSGHMQTGARPENGIAHASIDPQAAAAPCEGASTAAGALECQDAAADGGVGTQSAGGVVDEGSQNAGGVIAEPAAEAVAAPLAEAGARAAAVASAAAQPLPEDSQSQQEQGHSQTEQERRQQLPGVAGDEAGLSQDQQQQQQLDGVASAGAGLVGNTSADVDDAVPDSAVVRALEEARAQAGARLMMQVEALTSRLARVELLVGRAEQVANAMQADYHQDRFRTFPHVNSPAWLIRRLTQAKPEIWHGPEAAAV